jgi:hypothetical protein
MLPDTIVKAIGSLPAVVRSGRRVNGLFHAHQQTDKQRMVARSRGEPDALKGASPVRRGAERRPP